MAVTSPVLSTDGYQGNEVEARDIEEERCSVGELNPQSVLLLLLILHGSEYIGI